MATATGAIAWAAKGRFTCPELSSRRRTPYNITPELVRENSCLIEGAGTYSSIERMPVHTLRRIERAKRRFSHASTAAIGLVAVIAGCNTDLRFDAPDAALLSDSSASPDVEAGRDAGTCHADSDCSLSTLHCDTASGACVACLVNAECSADGGLNRCDTTVNACVACVSDTDCASSDQCLTSIHICIPRCSASNKCAASTARCDVPKGYCIECASDGECTRTGRAACEPTSGQCVGCLTDAQCASPTARCDTAIHTCVTCLSGVDCASNVCDPILHACVAH